MEKWKLIVCVIVMCLAAMVTITESTGVDIRRVSDKYNGKGICDGMYLCDTQVHGIRSRDDCFPITSVCDGVMDCPSGVDERNCPSGSKVEDTSTTQCPIDRYSCMDGTNCANLCDGNWECLDGEDERLCSKWCTCPEGYYRCKGENKCVQLWSVCDGYPNCKYGDDECSCKGCQCGPEQFKCSDNKTCVDAENVCDTVEDCPQGEDEKECPSSCTCAPTQFLCPNTNLCIESHELCDCGYYGYPYCYDCPGGEDESGELCGYLYYK